MIVLLAVLPALAREEFVGPFASWTNIKTYGAAGDGISDDSAAIQSALTRLGLSGASPVLYFPPGTYAVSKPLLLAERNKVALIGYSPASVRIQWRGVTGGSVLHLNGVAFSRFSRITFDGAGKAAVLIDQSWDNHKPYFDTGNEYSDDVFTGAGIGIRGGNLDYGFAETSVLRSKFLSLTTGILLGNFNALDLWVWDSLFDHCGTGITNNPGAGAWHVYNSTFLYSRVADNSIGNTGAFSFVGNYSVGASPFLAAGETINPALITVQANRINSTVPISIRNQGPLLMLDNIVGSNRSVPGVTASFPSDIDLISIGNRYAGRTGVSTVGRLTTMDDLTLQSNRFAAPPPITTPPNTSRTIIEVPAGATSNVIQAAIDSAARLNGQKAVVHIPFGQYSGVSITVPPCDL
ncbi:MAG TPA: glycosyl hydrolase family 28-related protein, partial [Bryobacteraceae bacterium]